MIKHLFGLIILSFITSACSFSASSEPESPETPTPLIQLSQHKIISDFKFVDHNSQPFGLADLRGQWSLVFFGFTHCPDICPPTLIEMANLYKKMKQANLPNEQLPQFIFASVDPKRDTVEKIKTYVKGFHPDFKGIVGDKFNLIALSKQLGVYYLKADIETDSDDEHNAHQPSDDEHSAHQPSNDEHSAHQPSDDEHSAHQPSDDEHSAHQPSNDEHSAHQPSNDDYLINHTGNIIIFNPEGLYIGFFRSPHHSEKMVELWTTLTQKK